MKSLNKVYLLGNLGQAPELRTATNGQFYTRLSLATHRRWKGENEQWQELTDWHSVMVWGNQAKSCASRLTKGSPVFVEGQLSPYEGKNEKGEKTFKLSIHAQRVTFFNQATLDSANAS